MKLNNIILVPTDFSDPCANAADHAIKIAQIVKFKVVLFHVINKDSESLFAGEKDIKTAVENKLKHLVSELKKQNQGVEIDYMFQEGSIFDLIHEVADDIGANMILLGTHGKKGMQHLLGSYAMKVIIKSKIPTLVVQKKPFSGYKNILLPVNSFTEPRQKVGIAISVAKMFGSTIHIFKEVLKDPGEMSRIEIITKQIAEAFNKAGISFEVFASIKPGETAKELVEVAVEKNLDAILMVTDSQIGSSIFSIGSWNEKLLFNEAQIPVMCINPIEYGQIYFDF
jgi:nucleotide-binding universal stress UspA family protein